MLGKSIPARLSWLTWASHTRPPHAWFSLALVVAMTTCAAILQGMLGKQGGGSGGHKNWKNRYFVLTEHLAYYTDQAAFAKDPKKPLGIVSLNCFYCSAAPGDTFDLILNAYPKSLVLRAASKEERDDWMAAIMAPLEDLKRPPQDILDEQEEMQALLDETYAGAGAAAAE